MGAPWPREKLVRRHVPDQLRARGETIETRIAEPGEMLGLLKAKLREEIDELFEALDASAATRKDHPQIIEELADVYDVLDALENSLDGPHTSISVSVRRTQKRDEKGKFTDVVMKLDEPVPMILHCPKCKAQHVDRGVYATTRVHRSHLCAGCGHVWRPFDYATVGVEDVAVYKFAGSGNVIGGGSDGP